MDLKEVRTIVNKFDSDETQPVRIQINYGDHSGSTYCDIKAFSLVNGELTLIVDANVVPQYR
jgi:hypothetical protein